MAIAFAGSDLLPPSIGREKTERGGLWPPVSTPATFIRARGRNIKRLQGFISFFEGRGATLRVPSQPALLGDSWGKGPGTTADHVRQAPVGRGNRYEAPATRFQEFARKKRRSGDREIGIVEGHRRLVLLFPESCPGVYQMKPKKTRPGIEMTAAVRQQTAPEQRRFNAALELLLTEMVRQEIAGRREGQNEDQEATR